MIRGAAVIPACFLFFRSRIGEYALAVHIGQQGENGRNRQEFGQKLSEI
jgi:hypothetical protein